MTKSIEKRYKKNLVSFLILLNRMYKGILGGYYELF